MLGRSQVRKDLKNTLQKLHRAKNAGCFLYEIRDR